MTREQARQFRQKIERAAALLPDSGALDSAELFPLWSGSADYEQGDRCRYLGGLYRCRSAITANPSWTPDVTAAHWERVTAGQDGTRDNPISAAAGMRYFKGLYYTDGGALYLCTRDDTGEGTILYYTPSQLTGTYFERVD